MLKNLYKEELGISNEVFEFVQKLEGEIASEFKNIDQIAEFNQLKVLKAMQKNRLSDMHFQGTTGYGYNDLGRDALEEIYKDVFKGESALVRPQIISGTHALTIALFGNLRHGDELLSPVGAPYDTLHGVIGIRETKGSLVEHGITYRQVDLLEDSSFDYEGIKNAINEKTKLVTIQRSKGYSLRKSFSVEEIGELISFIRSVKKDVIIMVDNCYGEFVSEIEPLEVGADLIVGSLIKNPGGGLAPVGGYIVGKEEYVDNASFRLSAPGLGKEVGPSLGITGALTQGLFLAPNVVSGSVKTAVLCAKVFEELGFETVPRFNEKRADIVQAIKFLDSEKLIEFCVNIQKAAPVDSFVTPKPWAMPGYDNDIIMAAGSFVQGSSIELSADAPIREPYAVFMQGALTYNHGKIGIMTALNGLVEKGLISI